MMTISELVKQAHDNSRAKGWWDGATDPAATVPEKIALIHSEASEALEEWRDGRMDGHGPGHECMVCKRQTPKPVGLSSELADIVIRVADLAGALGIDLETAIKEKVAYNATRPHRHGGKRA